MSTATSDTDGSRSVLAGSFRRAFAESDSRLLRSYVVVSGLVGALLVVFLLLALPVWVFNTLGGSEFATFSRAFLLVGAALLVVGLVAPVLSAARRHRRGEASARTDFLLASTGYLFVGSLYLSLVISAPPDARDAPPAALAPVVEFLYALPATYAVAPPLLAAAAMWAVHRFAP
ncbi:hypothetical protein NGM10_12295 [Halorussus salilacus]|uniref:hypothetical protein n=1 Tax=Halorussus salilacus TaxID=2953750 RepID=UPI0020A12C2B|nr:hypothetical protein [Halorussus salilacus]USZ67505.1 hypothetical protein NGM10_12295 [Halorussus salilacus]